MIAVLALVATLEKACSWLVAVLTSTNVSHLMEVVIIAPPASTLRALAIAPIARQVSTAPAWFNLAAARTSMSVLSTMVVAMNYLEWLVSTPLALANVDRAHPAIRDRALASVAVWT